MPFGTEVGSLKTLKKSLARGGSGGAWIKYVPKNGALNVRFITEPETWVNYVEHYDLVRKTSYPCTQENGCPGCTSDARKSNRYLTNAVDVDTDRVIALQLPKDLANRLVVKYEKNGTLVDRDYELSRSGDGLDTVYDYDQGAVSKKNLLKYTALDLLKVLEDAYNNVFDPSDDEDDEDTPQDAPVAPSRPGVKGLRKSTAARRNVDHDAEDDGEDTPQDAPAYKPPAAKRAAKKAAPVVPDPEPLPPEPAFEVDEDDDEDVQDADVPDDDEGEEYDEETLRTMPLGALRKIARDEFEIDVTGKTQDQIVDEMLEESDDDGDDEPPF